MTMRDELRQARDEVVGASGPGRDHRDRLATTTSFGELEVLESGIRDWLIATGADGFDPDDRARRQEAARVTTTARP